MLFTKGTFYTILNEIELDLYDHLKRAQRSTEILLKICIGRLWIQRFKIKFQNYWIHKILTQYFFTLDILGYVSYPLQD